MKQNITLQQFFSLDKEPSNKIQKWIDDKGYSPELTIGNMIEFMWEDNLTFVIPETTDLCDALWKAVKELLETH